MKTTEQKYWKKPVYRNLRLFIKLFLATYKYGMILTIVAFGAIYTSYIFVGSNDFLKMLGNAVKSLYPSAEVSGSESAGARLQGCIIPGIPQCDGAQFSENSIFTPVN